MHARVDRLTDRSPLRLAVVLIGLALVVRIGVIAGAAAFGPSDSVGDVGYHAMLVDDPLGHLRGDAADADVDQYAPFLGVLEWVTAEPWIALGASDATALRLSSVTWDLLAMALLLYATARRFPRNLLFVGLMWALSPLVWPASAYSAQDETISAAIVAGIVALLFTRRRLAAIVLGVIGLFLAKILLGPVVLAVLLTTPKGAKARAWAVAAATAICAATFTWLLSGSDGLGRQASYSTEVVGFSISVWSTLVLHNYLASSTAIHLSLAVTTVGLAGCLLLWARARHDDLLETPRLSSALLFVAFGLLAVSNPEYLCIAAPMAIVACIGLEPILQPWLLVGVATLAWSINGVYYLLRKAYDPTGSLLGVTGIDRPVGARVHFFDVTHQVLLALFLFAVVYLVRNYLLGVRYVEMQVTSDPPLAA